MGLNMKEKKAVTREYKPRYQKASKKEKKAMLDEFTGLTGCHRKSAVRILGAKAVKQVMAYVDSKPVKRRPSNRKGKRTYTDEVINALRQVWTFFRFKCGKILAPLMRQQMTYIAAWPAFGITGEIAEMLKKISPASIDRYLKKDKQAISKTEREKPHQTHQFPEKPHPHPYFLHKRGTQEARILAN